MQTTKQNQDKQNKKLNKSTLLNANFRIKYVSMMYLDTLVNVWNHSALFFLPTFKI